MDNTIIQQGRFTADGNNKVLQIRSDFDWIRVYNETALAQEAADLGYEFYYQRGMTAGRGVVWTKYGTDDPTYPITVGQIAANSGFTIINSTENVLGGAVTINTSGAGSDAVRPVLLTGSTAGLSAGSIVRLTNVTGGVNLNGYDFAIDTVVANTSFRIAGALATAPGANTTGGKYRIVNYDPIYYPRHRYILNITKASSAVITLNVPSGYAVGQKVRIIVPSQRVAGTAIWGMTEINNVLATITAVNDAVGTQSITVNVDSSAFTAFTFPTAAQGANAFQRAMVVPVGMNTPYAISQSVDELSDATENLAFIGVKLVAGNSSPAGNDDDVIYWVAGKSFSVDNQ